MFSNIKAGMIVTIIPATTMLTKYVNVEVMATGCGYGLAEGYSDIAATQANIYSTLEGKDVPNDVRAYEYILFKDNSGKVIAMPDAWIDSVNVIESISATLELSLDNLEVLSAIHKYLDARGIAYTSRVN